MTIIEVTITASPDAAPEVRKRFVWREGDKIEQLEAAAREVLSYCESHRFDVAKPISTAL